MKFWFMPSMNLCEIHVIVIRHVVINKYVKKIVLVIVVTRVIVLIRYNKAQMRLV